MGSSPPSRLSALQRELLGAFFAREKRFFLTGGGALAGFYFGHRDTEDLDLFTAPGPDLAEAAHALEDAARALGATVEPMQTYGDFRRLRARRGEESCLIDLVVDRAPMIEPDKPLFGEVRVDSLREIAANKIAALHSRSEIKDLVDLRALVEAGVPLDAALTDAAKKEGAADDPAALAFILDQLSISKEARLPGGVDPTELDAFRRTLVKKLRAIAFARTQGKR